MSPDRAPLCINQGGTGFLLEPFLLLNVMRDRSPLPPLNLMKAHPLGTAGVKGTPGLIWVTNSDVSTTLIPHICLLHKNLPMMGFIISTIILIVLFICYFLIIFLML